jgi:hypothetical protein
MKAVSGSSKADIPFPSSSPAPCALSSVPSAQQRPTYAISFAKPTQVKVGFGWQSLSLQPSALRFSVLKKSCNYFHPKFWPFN